jgi:ankyrin repeat protein
MSESLPPRPHLNWLKNRAKERLAALRAADPKAKRADALRAVAGEYGFPSWRALKAAVDARSGSPEAVVDQFKAAVRRGDAAAVERLLATELVARANVNAPLFAFDSRAIHEARRHPAVIDVLLAHGADINLKSAWWAGGFGVLETADPATAEFLISRGATVDIFAAAHLDRLDRARELLDGDPSLVHAKGGDGCRPLHFAGSIEMIDLLLDLGAEIDARDVDHESTAAQWLVQEAPGTRVRHLLKRGAAVDVFMAAALDDAARLSALLEADPSLADAQVGGARVPLCPQAPGGHIYVYKLGRGRTPLEVAMAVGAEWAVWRLMEGGTPRQRLLANCSTGARAGVEAMLRRDPDAVRSLPPADHARLPRAAWDGNAAAVRLMLDVGFDPAAQGPDTGTALHCAAWQGRADIVRLILDHPAYQPELVHATEPTHGSTPLGWCCHGSTHGPNPKGDYPAVARLLVAAGAVPGPNLADASPAVRDALG